MNLNKEYKEVLRASKGQCRLRSRVHFDKIQEGQKAGIIVIACMFGCFVLLIIGCFIN